MGKKKSSKTVARKEIHSYDINKFCKRSDQLSHYIYSLPLDIKKIIFRIAIKTYMDTWKTEHQSRMTGWFGDSSNWHLPYSVLDVIQGWGIQAPVPNYFNYVRP